MDEHRHGSRTRNGDALVEKHQQTYEGWWLEKTLKKSGCVPCDPPEIISKVEYVGNSVYGTAILTVESGKRFYTGTGTGRPRKTDVELLPSNDHVQPDAAKQG